MPDNPRTWLQIWPDVAALIAGLLGVIIRLSTADGARPPRAVFADTCGTVALAWLTFKLVTGAGMSVDLAFGIAGFTGALGWEWARRRFIAAADKRLK